MSANDGAKASLAAFSLLELLVLIAVIAILAALLLPVTSRSREKAREARCLSNLKQIHAGFLLYQADNDGRFPTSFRWQNKIWTHSNFVGGKDGWDTNVPPARGRPLYPYLGASDAFSCPADAGMDNTNKDGLVLAPSLFAAIGSSYLYKIGNPRRLGETELVNGLAGKKMESLKEPAKFLLMYEPPANSGNGGTTNNKVFYWHRARKPGTATGLASDNPDKDRGPRVSPILYVDGHVTFLDFTHGYGGFAPHTELDLAQ